MTLSIAVAAEASPPHRDLAGPGNARTRPGATARLADPPISPAARDLLTRPDIAALVDQVCALTARDRAALAEAFRVNSRQHSLRQIRICHRVSVADPVSFPYHAEVRALVWRIAAAPRDGHHDAAAAASDLAFVLLSGSLLTPWERELFDAPWHAVVGAPRPASGAMAQARHG